MEIISKSYLSIFDRLEKYPIINKFGGKVRVISDNIYQLMRGEIYIIDGHKIFTFGGATSIDKVHRIKNIDWWEQENLNNRDINNAFDNLEKHNYEVDFIITHTCSASALTYLCVYFNKYIKSFDNYNKLFEEFKAKIKYNKWYFGHFHVDLDMKENEVALFNRIVKINSK